MQPTTQGAAPITHPFRLRCREPRRLLALVLLIGMTSMGCARRSEPIEIPDPAVDARIQRAVEARLAEEPGLAGELIRVEVEGTRVLLYGSVQGIGAWKCALRNAELVAGVESVVDYLILERGPRDITCLAQRVQSAE